MSDQLLQMQEVLKKSLVKIKKLEAELEAAKAQTAVPAREPVAIVGLGCRFPGGINNLESLWKALIEKRDTSSPIPKERWDNDAIYDPDPLRPGKTHARTAAFLENDVRAFDAGFFGIVPREAKSIDPLQRMILEVVYEALEEANIPADSLKGTNTAVYIALGNSDYIQARFRSGNLETMDVYDATGIPFATAAGRVSYLYDLQGPNFALDAACASAIVGLHLASEALQKGEADTAIVASANLLLTPELFVGLSKLGSLSASGKCKAFDNDADGYVRGEGCGVAILRRRSDALKHKDKIHALILGSSVRHDGLSNGFTAPNPKAQLDTIHQAIKEAGVTVNDVSFVEAHGIGNKFTDAMEIQAIANGYKGRKDTIYVGSLKPNIGHLEACIGMAMLFKVIGTLQHKTVAPNIYFDVPNEDIPWKNIPVRIPTEPVALDGQRQPLKAAINLSGYSGTNVHMIFEEAPAATDQQVSDIPGAQLLVWSAKSPEALKALAQKYLDNLSNIRLNPLASIAHTLQSGRAHWDYKLSTIVSDTDALEKVLKDFTEGIRTPAYSTNDPDTVLSRDVAFLFTGQGAQYHGMCREYYETELVFRKAVDQCAALLDQMLPAPIKQILWDETDSSLINQTFYTQPALFVVEYALAQLWISRGIHPAAVAGHSIGEFVALTIAEAISLNDALRIVAIRGHYMQSLPAGTGAMAALITDEETARFYVDQTNGLVDIAAINAPKAVTISGERNAVLTLCDALKEVKIRSVQIPVSHAFHSHQMDPILEAFRTEVAKIKFQAPVIPVISNVTGKELSPEDLTPEYFSRHLRQAVRFADGIQYLSEELGIQTFLECGPNPTLIALGSKTATAQENLWISSAKKGDSDRDTSMKALQQLYLAGHRINWKALSIGQHIPKVNLPTYAWQREIYWENPVRGIGQPLQPDTPKITPTYIESELVRAEARHVTVTKENLMAIMQLEGAETLGLLPGQKIDPNKSLREQGFDSMMSGEFLTKLEKHFNTQLEMSLLHTYGTLNELQRYLVDEFLGGGEIDEGSAAVTMSDIVFGSDSIGSSQVDNWHEIKESDPAWLKVFKKIDKMISI